MNVAPILLMMIPKLLLKNLIPSEEMVVTITHTGYIKTVPTSTYRNQKRGGRGVTGMGTGTDDFVQDMFVANSHDFILFFTNKGKVYWQKVYQLPQGSRTAKGESCGQSFKSW